MFHILIIPYIESEIYLERFMKSDESEQISWYSTTNRNCSRNETLQRRLLSISQSLPRGKGGIK